MKIPTENIIYLGINPEEIGEKVPYLIVVGQILFCVSDEVLQRAGVRDAQLSVALWELYLQKIEAEKETETEFNTE
jgi:hypothetical protein